MANLIFAFNALFFSILLFFGSKEPTKTSLGSEIPMCYAASEASFKTGVGAAGAQSFKSLETTPVSFESDSTKAYSMPLLTKTSTGQVLLSWTEKEEQGLISFCLAFSTDNGKTFSEKKVIYAGMGIGNSRLMRAKVLAKKDGSLVAVFSNRTDAGTGNQQGGRGRGGRSSDIVYCVSKDGGNTWTSPQSVDSDPTKGIVRGFFDAAVLANDEIAVVYLKDVANSTKHEERDLRLVITQNGVFQPEKVIDPVVCDCCNVNLLVDGKGVLYVYYRDNNDDVRDIANMMSTDNGATFSKPQIVYADGWKINGCPHSGAISSVHGKSALVAWYSGAETESGIRLVTQGGKKHFVLSEASAKNPCLMSNPKFSVMLWEQNQGENNTTQLVFRKINAEEVSETVSLKDSGNAANATGVLLGNQMLVAHEVKQPGKKNSLKIATMVL